MTRIFAGHVAVIGIAVALALAACGDGPGHRDGQHLERTTVKVGVLPIPDSAPLYVALANGFFEQEGLTVQPVTIQGGAAALPQLESGALDVSLSNYVSALLAASKGVPIKIVADLYHARPNVFDIVVPKNSPITGVAGLKGKTILVNTLSNIGTLSVTETLAGAGLTPADVKFVATPFPDMTSTLISGGGDAAWMTEPFLTLAVRWQGFRVIADTMTGKLADLPIGGWIAMDEWVRDNPRTLAAFRRALDKGQRLAAGDREEVEAVLPSYTRIDPATASAIALGGFPTKLDPARLQRVADLMLRYGYVSEPIDVKSVVAAAPG
ncbi:ABC transporter substrate-binding protein [Nonomuraea sp. LPB2021202275-12-8]|uniref:ABC transporter substrate-binding protein n=1 Tax=Nonomuraea sp. LPB2021202275-12-8 TaxID=3120159 RepID=UPI00300C04BD